LIRAASTMADILEGTSDHLHFAPLSSDQTRAICRHLQAQLDDVLSKCRNLDKEKDVGNRLHSNLVNDFNQDRARVDDLQTALEAMQLELDSAKKELKQLRANAQRLRSDLESTNKHLGDVRDDHRNTEQLAQGTADGLERTSKTLKLVRDLVEGKVQPDVEKLREELRRLEHDAGELRSICDQIKASAKDQRDELRATEAMAQGIADNLAKTDSSMDQLAQETKDLKNKLAGTQKTLDGTRNGLLRLQDNQVRTASAVGDLQSGLKRVNEGARSQKENMDTAERNLDLNQDRLQNAVGDLGCLKDTVARLELTIASLKSSLELMTAKNEQMQSQLERTDSIARGAKKGLDQTNSVVLPNLALDAHVASSHDFAQSMRTPRMSS